MTAKAKEIYTIRDNVVDPSGSGLVGSEIGYDMRNSAIAHPKFRWRDRLAEVDVYAAGDGLMLHFYCPQCAQALRVTSAKKEIRFEPPTRLSIAAFRCTWPQCGLHIRVENNIAIDMR